MNKQKVTKAKESGVSSVIQTLSASDLNIEGARKKFRRLLWRFMCDPYCKIGVKEP